MNKTTPTPRRLITCNKMIDKIDALLDGRADHRLELAAKMPRNKLNKIRNGKQYMRADEIWRISGALKVNVAWLLNDEATPDQKKLGSDIGATWSLDSHADEGTDGRNKPTVGKPKDSPRSK